MAGIWVLPGVNHVGIEKSLHVTSQCLFSEIVGHSNRGRRDPYKYFLNGLHLIIFS